MEQQLLLQVSNEAAVESTPSSNNKQELKVEVERTGIKEIDEGLYWPLSGKPYADLIITKTAVHPSYYMYLPKKLNKELPPDGAPAVLNYGRKSWDVFFCGSNSNSKFSPSEWKRFADDNNLKVGDGLVLELSECSTSKIHFKVMILRGDFPSELLPEDEGANPANPIII